MDKKVYIAPSTDPAKTTEDLKKYVKEITPFADFLHCDVMDGKFVERKTIDFNTVKLIHSISTIPLDIHLMIEKPYKYIKKYRKAGATNITVHYESFKSIKQVISCLNKIKKFGIMCGISIKPETSVLEIRELLSYVDLVLVMSVEPGKSGQNFINSTLDKIKELDIIKNEYNSNFLIEVDGGVSQENSKDIINVGANILVSGSYIYNSKDKQQAIETLNTF